MAQEKVIPWEEDFPSGIGHTSIDFIRNHGNRDLFIKAKAGDEIAAVELVKKCIKGIYVNGVLTSLTPYNLNTRLGKGDAFLVYVKSSKVSNYSRIQNGGVNVDDSQNLYFKAKAQCRVEYVE